MSANTMQKRPSASSIPWFKTLMEDFRAETANVFLLHGNVFDVVHNNQRVTDFLVTTLARHFNFVTYAPDQGIRFPGPSDSAKYSKQRLKKVLMGEQPAPSRKQTEAEKLLAKQNNNQSLQSDDDDLVLPQSPTGAITALVDFLEQADPELNDDGVIVRDRTCVIVERMDLICPPGDKATLSDQKAALMSLIHRAGTNRSISARQGMMILLSPSLEEIHPDLRTASSHIRAIQIPLPNYRERLLFAEECIPAYETRLDDGVTLSELASQTAGLGKLHIEDIVLSSKLLDGVITRELIRERKKILFATEYAEVLEVLETDVTLDMVGGHSLIKEYLQQYVIDVLKNEKFKSFSPLSLAFLGASGTGKTFTAQAIANEIGWSCVLLRPEKTKGGIVGESERRLRKAFDGIEALAPCVVFIDEIDQGGRRTESTAGGGGDAVEANAFGAMLEFFGNQAHRGNILTIVASNRPDLVDPAFMRPGRMDDKFPFLPPETSDERMDILVRLIKRHCGTALDTPSIQNIADKTESWTQAELERLVLKARAISEITSIDILSALQQAHKRLITSTRDIQKMTMLALEACDDLALVPERWQWAVGRKEARETARQNNTEASPFEDRGRGRSRGNLEDIASSFMELDERTN